ncbi:MAG: addiction module protein [Planctomycetota bacterium]
MLQEIRKLSVPERARLVEEVLDGMAEDDDTAIPRWQKELIEERLAAYEENPDDSVSWEEVKARLKADRERIALERLPSADSPTGLSVWQKKDLERRLAEDEKNPEDVVSWGSVRAELKRSRERIAREHKSRTTLPGLPSRKQVDIRLPGG